MNFGTGTSECWAESLNGSWLMRWPASFMRIWKGRSQKDLRRSYPSHVHVLLFVKPDPGHAIGASVGTGTCRHWQLKVSTQADNGNWEVYDRYQISDLCNASRGCQGSAHFLSCIPPKSKSEIWHLGSTTPRAKLQFAWYTVKQGPETIWTFDTFRFGKFGGPSNQQSLVARVTWSQSVWWKKKSCPSWQLHSIDSTFLGTKDDLEV